jgi:hypothetical protein
MEDEAERQKMIAHLSHCAWCLEQVRNLKEASHDQWTDDLSAERSWQHFREKLLSKKVPLWSRISFLQGLSAAALFAVCVLGLTLILHSHFRSDKDVYLSNRISFVTMSRGLNGVHSTEEGVYELAFRLPPELLQARRITVEIGSDTAGEGSNPIFRGEVPVVEGMEYVFLRVAPKRLAPGKYILQAFSNQEKTPSFKTTFELFPPSESP